MAGVDYTANYTPVINDFTWRVILIVMLLNKYNEKLLTLKLHSFMDKKVKV